MRSLMMIPTLVAVSIIAFVIIQLPPGDFLTSYIASLGETGEMASEAELAALKSAYGLDKPVYVQYALFIGRLARGDLGNSYRQKRPVAEIIRERFPATMKLAAKEMRSSGHSMPSSH